MLKWMAPMVLAGLAGCAAAPKDAGFGDVRREVAGRTGRQVEWDRGSADDHAVSSRVRSMLAAGLTADGAVRAPPATRPATS